MARKRRREARRSLPTNSPRYTPRRSFPVIQGRSYDYFPETGEIIYETPVRSRLKSPLAQRKSYFPKTYGVVSQLPPLSKAETKVLGLCESRKMREQVLHALNKSGQKGQKRPKWTKLSKVKC